MPVTPTVFCAVSAVIAVIPCTPQRANALRSAWMPAPPPESEPAMESTAGGAMRLDRLGGPGPLARLSGDRCAAFCQAVAPDGLDGSGGSPRRVPGGGGGLRRGVLQ